MAIRRVEVRPSALLPAQRARLLALLSAVPPGAGVDDPAVRALALFVADLDVPWWLGVTSRARYVSWAGVDPLLSAADRLAHCIDFGREPHADCRCSICSRRRRLLPEFHTFEEAEAVGLLGCDYGPRYDDSAPERAIDLLLAGSAGAR